VEGAFSKSVEPLRDLPGRAPLLESYTNAGSVALTLAPTEASRVQLSYDVSDKRYADPTRNDVEFTQHTVTLSPSYRFSPKTTVGAAVTFGKDDYGSPLLGLAGPRREPEWWEGRLSLVWLPTDTVTLFVSGGYQDRDYDETAAAATYTDPEGFDDYVYTAALTWAPTLKWTCRLLATRVPVESSVAASNFYVYDRYGLSISYLPVDPLKVTVGAFTDQAEQNVGLGDKRHGCSLDATWSFCQWAGIGASYEFKTKAAEAAGADYDSSITSVGMWVTF
jgi:hypothetical protein